MCEYPRTFLGHCSTVGSIICQLIDVLASFQSTRHLTGPKAKFIHQAHPSFQSSIHYVTSCLTSQPSDLSVYTRIVVFFLLTCAEMTHLLLEMDSFNTFVSPTSGGWVSQEVVDWLPVPFHLPQDHQIRLT